MAGRSFILVVMGMVLFLLSSVSYADVPDMINYQGKLTTSGGGLVNGTVQMTFSVYPDTLGSPAEWTETQDSVIVSKGMFSVVLGSKVSISTSVFDGSTKYLGIQVESDPEMTPTRPIVSAAYAFKSEYADTAEYARSAPGGGGGGWVDNGTIVRLETTTDSVGIGTTNPAKKLDVVGTVQMTGFKMTTGASDGYVLTSDGSGVGTWQAGGGAADNDWTFRITDGADTTLMTGGKWGIARYGNTLYGNQDSTHVNLGVACTTGESGQNYKYCSVGGGLGNTASGRRTTIGGGTSNSASREWATVGGGYFNIASGRLATVGGGHANTTSGDWATVGGGWGNTASGYLSTVSGGCANTADSFATVGGGWFNSASAYAATIPGGYQDTVNGDYSFATGRQVNLTSSADYTFAFGYNFTTSSPHSVIFYDADTETKVGIQTTSPTARLDVSGSTGYNQVRMRTSYTPTGTSDANGNTGDIAWNDNYFYVKTSAGWKRAALSTW